MKLQEISSCGKGVLFQYSNEDSSCVSVVVAEEPAQSLVPQNDTCGGFWNAFDRPVSQSLMAALEMIVLQVALDRSP